MQRWELKAACQETSSAKASTCRTHLNDSGRVVLVAIDLLDKISRTRYYAKCVALLHGPWPKPPVLQQNPHHDPGLTQRRSSSMLAQNVLEGKASQGSKCKMT